MDSMRISVLILAASLLLAGCAGGGQKSVKSRPFPKVSVPAVIQGDYQLHAEYMGEHWFDKYFSDPSGVSDADVEQAVVEWISTLDAIPVPAACSGVAKVIAKAGAAQMDTARFNFFCSKLQLYLYDPNSPLRNEDYYLPVAQYLAASPNTPENLRASYAHDVENCSKNRFGEVAPDFEIETIDGRIFYMHDVNAAYTMLFFSNPGCTACKGIIDEVMSREYAPEFIASGVLAIINVYVDEELDKWREYAHNYPDSWYSGFDPNLVIRSDRLYDLRAIPSLYLLDAQKRVLMKDAPTEKVLRFFDAMASNNY